MAVRSSEDFTWEMGYGAATVNFTRGVIEWSGEGTRQGCGNLTVEQTFEDFGRRGVPGEVLSEMCAPPSDIALAITESVRQAEDELKVRPLSDRFEQAVVCVEATTLRELFRAGLKRVDIDQRVSPFSRVMVKPTSIVLSHYDKEACLIVLLDHQCELGPPPVDKTSGKVGSWVHEAAYGGLWNVAVRLLDMGLPAYVEGEKTPLWCVGCMHMPQAPWEVLDRFLESGSPFDPKSKLAVETKQDVLRYRNHAAANWLTARGVE